MRTFWHSRDGGRTWTEMQVHPRSVLAAVTFGPSGIYDDGYGNLYRQTPPNGLDPRFVKVVRDALTPALNVTVMTGNHGVPVAELVDLDRLAQRVAERAWAWLAEGDPK